MSNTARQLASLRQQLEAEQRAFKALDAEHSRLLQLLDLCPHAFFASDTDGRVLFLNRAAANFLGQTRDRALGKTYADLTGNEGEAERMCKILRETVLLGEALRSEEHRLLDAAGNERVLDFHAIPYLDEDIGTSAVLGIATDIADRIQRERLMLERERLERELDLARTIQRGLLPDQSTPTQIDGFGLAGFNRSSQKTGGDYFDWAPMPDGRLQISIADVTGHGIGPALIAAECRAYFRMSRGVDSTAQAQVQRVNSLLCADLPHGQFVTAAHGLLDAAACKFELYSAGQGPMLFYDASRGEVRELPAQGIPLGILPQIPSAESQVVEFDAGDSLLLVTDGFIECEDNSGRRLGMEPILQWLHECHTLEPAAMVETLYARTVELTGTEDHADDLTALVIKFAGH